MKLSSIKRCEWCEKKFTGRRILSDGEDYDGAPCWCSYACFYSEMEHGAEMDVLMKENVGFQRALLDDTTHVFSEQDIFYRETNA